jgi:hypothetical protein
VVGRADENGELTGIRIAYLYPDLRTAIVGNFSDGILESGRVAYLKTVIDDRGIKVPIFTEPTGTFNFASRYTTFMSILEFYFQALSTQERLPHMIF